MGSGASKLPPIRERDLRILLSYNLQETHIKKMWNKFNEADRDCNGVWTVQEFFKVIDEPRLSMRGPIIEALFFMADGKSEGCIDFQDFLVALTSFCALSKEEMLHLFFIIVDKDRNGRIEKEEMLDYSSYAPGGYGAESMPIFPVNNKNALDLFRGGKWEGLEFDGLAQLCERFPYISYPAFHLQEQYRTEFLGKAFWNKLDAERAKNRGIQKTRNVRLPGSKERIEVKLPGRCTMQELLEYSRRRTVVHAGRRVMKAQDEQEIQISSSITKERDDQIARCPLLSMIRNSRCMYYVPCAITDATANATAKARKRTLRPEMELPELELDPEPGGGSRGTAITGAWGPSAMQEAETSESSSGSYESSDASEDLPDSQ